MSTEHQRWEGELFRLLAENVKDYAIFIIDADRNVLSWSRGAEHLLGYHEDEIIGRSADLFFTPEDRRAGAPEREVEMAQTTGRGDDDRWHVRKDGSRFWSNGVLTPLRDAGGALRGYAKILRDRTELKRAEDELAARNRLIALSADVGASLSRAREVPAVLQECAEALVRHLGAALARVWTFNERDGVLELKASAGLTTRLDGSHARVPVGSYKIGLIARERRPHLTNAVVGDPRIHDQEWAKREGLVAFAGYPLLAEDRLLGVLALFAREPLPAAILDGLATVAASLALAVSRLRAEAAAARLAAIVESTAEPIISATLEGVVTSWNRGAERLYGYTAAEMVGQSVARIFPPEQAGELEEGLARLRRGEHVDRETVRLRRDGGRVEVAVSISPTRDAAGGVVGVSAIAHDISERKRVERRRLARLAVTQVLAAAETVAEAAPRILQAVGEGLGWDMGAFWAVDRRAGVLRCLDVWHRPDVTAGGFEAATRRRTFEPGVGLPGRVWATGRPAWVPDVTRDANFPRAPLADRDGLHGAFACPVRAGDAVLGVVEFFSGAIREPDADLLEMMATVGGQVGLFIERRQAEEALRAGEERLRLALGAGQMGVWDWDLRTGALQWTDALEPMHGLARGTFRGTFEAYRELVHPDDRARVARAIADAVETRSAYATEFRVVWPDGSVHWIASRGQVFTDEADRPVRMIGVGTDVTERRRAEETARFLAGASASLSALVDSESTLQTLARLAVPGFADWCAVDLAGPGGALRRLAVAHADPAKLQWIHELSRRYPPDPAAPHGPPQVLRTGRPELMADIPDELLVRSARDAEHLRILRELGLKSFVCVPLVVQGQPIGVLTFVTAESGRRYDAGDLAVAEDLAHRASIALDNARLYREAREADRRKDEFLAMLAHELRNPLAPIRNALHILKLPAADPATTAHAREVAERQVHHLTRLVDDLLDVSRIQRGKIRLRKEPVELHTVVARAVETARPLVDAQGHELTVSLPPEPVWLEADPVRLAQVIANLLTNAAKYTESAGRIDLIGERQADAAVVRVRDTGIGIAPELLPKVFDLFVQSDRALDRAQGGLGIGLTLVRSLVELHGGTVEAHSAGPGRGSEFVVRPP